jgi:ABC-2 type transport system ATP-binding protein
MAALRALDGDAVSVLDVGLRRPTLDDVFLALTGHAAEADAGNNAEGDRPNAERSVEKNRDQEPAR